jgi:tRNA(Ile)-lysidine synthase
MLDRRFNELISALNIPRGDLQNGIVVGVSGGADSTALAVLLHEWTSNQGISLLAVICDHGLRKEAATEAEGVRRQLEDLGIPAIIRSLGVKPGGSIQERARAARYNALLEETRRKGSCILAVGHHELDQAETISQRLESGAFSPASLAGILPSRPMEDALLIRPFLSVPPDEIRAFLNKRGISWVEDPSNQDQKYTRVRIRQALKAAPSRIRDLVAIGDENRMLLEEIRSEALQRLSYASCEHRAGGARSLQLARLGADASGIEAFRRIIQSASGRYPMLSDQSIKNFLNKGMGCLGGSITWRQGGSDWVGREPSRMSPEADALPWSCWDGRLRLGECVPHDCHIQPLGSEAATAMRRAGKTNLPQRILATVPALTRKGEVIAVPDLGVGLKIDTKPAWKAEAEIVQTQKSEAAPAQP